MTAITLLLFVGVPTLAEQQPEFKGTLRTETTARPPMEIPFWASAEQLRMDITQPMDMTVVWSFGAEPSMRMIRHEKREYVEWGPTQLENARQMVQRANRGTSIAEVGPLRFEPTGARDTFEGWDAFEVRLLPKEKEDGSRLWLSRDADYGLVEFFAHYALALHETTQFPMTGTPNDPLGLNDGASLPLDELGSAVGLEGRVVRIVDDGRSRKPANPATITLLSLEPGPNPEDLFTVPDGYIRKAQLSSGVQ
jgi:hypothetical protein